MPVVINSRRVQKTDNLFQWGASARLTSAEWSEPTGRKQPAETREPQGVPWTDDPAQTWEGSADDLRFRPSLRLAWILSFLRNPWRQ